MARMTRTAAIEPLKNRKVYVNGKSAEIQKKLFEIGFEWPAATNEIINTDCPFKPFDRVLVRDYDNEQWRASIYSHYDKDNAPYCHITCGAEWRQGIPYEGNEYLLGTTDKPEVI